MKRLPADHPDYDANLCFSKAAVVKNRKERGFRVVVAGVRSADILPAREADVVFAKKRLLDLCRRENIKTEPFADFRDVCRCIKEI